MKFFEFKSLMYYKMHKLSVSYIFNPPTLWDYHNQTQIIYYWDALNLVCYHLYVIYIYDLRIERSALCK